MNMFSKVIADEVNTYFAEDEIANNIFYLQTLPTDKVICTLKIKSDLVLSGMPYFVAAFNYLGAQLEEKNFLKYEGKSFIKGEVIDFELPFNIALTGERVALNLLQRSSSVSTMTKKFVDEVANKNIKILDTRKTTPGLRSLEKYAVRVGGGHNHRFSQNDVWMIKDNHKSFFGGLKNAYNFFLNQQTFYQPIVVEIHNLEELKLATELNVKHVMLDNFSIEDIGKAIEMKKDFTIEISGGVNLENIKQYLIEGVDAISIGALTHSAPHVDLSMKMRRA